MSGRANNAREREIHQAPHCHGAVVAMLRGQGIFFVSLVYFVVNSARV